MKVKLTVLESKCRSNLHKKGDVFILGDTCPPLCHELWQSIYPYAYTLINGGDLDYGKRRAKKFKVSCPDERRVLIQGEVMD